MMIPIFKHTETSNWSWAKVLRHWVEIDPYQPEYLTDEYYRIKYAVANFVKPESICEIGVRAGYSAAAFLQAGHTKRYVGIDFDAGTHGGVCGYVQFARNTILSYGVNAEFYVGVDSQKLDTLPEGPFDLLHVDGDHTIKGAYHDIELGMKSAKWILVDDTDFMPEVAHATFQAIKDYNVEEAYYVYDFRYRGNILIKNPSDITPL